MAQLYCIHSLIIVQFHPVCQLYITYSKIVSLHLEQYTVLIVHKWTLSLNRVTYAYKHGGHYK